MFSKVEIRRMMKERIASLSPSERNEKSCVIAVDLISSDLFEKAQSVFLYRSMEDEVATAGLIEMALSIGKKVCLPRIDGSLIQLVPYTEGTPLLKNEYGIEEPTGVPLSIAETRNIDIAVVPLRAFDRDKHRLGRGKGYYDRFLKSFKGAKVGVAFSLQECECVPTEAHDVKLDCIFTEKGHIV